MILIRYYFSIIPTAVMMLVSLARIINTVISSSFTNLTFIICDCVVAHSRKFHLTRVVKKLIEFKFTLHALNSSWQGAKKKQERN